MSAVNYNKPFFQRIAGLTLLEMLLTISVMSVLVAAIAPSFSEVIERQKAERLIKEIEWLFVLAKSEAVMRSSTVAVTSSGIPNEHANSMADKKWVLTASDLTSREVIGRVIGEQFSNLNVTQTFTKEVHFDPLTGIPNINGSIFVNPENIDVNIKVVVNNMTGRIYACEINGKGGYGKCPKS